MVVDHESILNVNLTRWPKRMRKCLPAIQNEDDRRRTPLRARWRELIGRVLGGKRHESSFDKYREEENEKSMKWFFCENFALAKYFQGGIEVI